MFNPLEKDANFSEVKLTGIRQILFDDHYPISNAPQVTQNRRASNIKWKRLSVGANPYHLPKSKQVFSKYLNIVAALTKKNFVVQIRHPMYVSFFEQFYFGSA